MPLFHRQDTGLALVTPTKFTNEKELQTLIEQNLDVVFSCRLVSSEFQTGQRHGGRIDTLAISEDGNPTIIEYKVVESSDLVNQSLFYLSWIKDHRGDFEVAARASLGDVDIDWDAVRVICIAPGYKKYDLHAVEVMGAGIELWQFKLYSNGALLLDEVFKRHEQRTQSDDNSSKNPIMVAAGKKAAETPLTGSYTMAQHLDKASPEVATIMSALREAILQLGDDVQEVPKKHYVAFKVAKNFTTIEVQKARVLLYAKLDPSTLGDLPSIARDVRSIGHYGTGDLEIRIATEAEVETAMEFVRRAYEMIGG